MTVLTTSTGESIKLEKELSSGGEGTVWTTDRKGYVAKIYNSATPERIEKLEVMVAHPPHEPNAHLNHTSFAWPQSLLQDKYGQVLGFLMPEIEGGRELIQIYNPQRRQRQKLEIDWRFLHFTALNVAAIIQAIHAEGYVLGDIKPQNILVNNRALPSIIDTDSFQVRHPSTGNIHHCLVASEDFTPVELLGKDVSQVEQTPVQDCFRLAIIIHCLLFGDKPFKGKWIGTGDSPEPSELIRRGFWCYAPNSLIQPSDLTIPLEVVHPEVKRCFLRCFNDGHTQPHLRPSAEEWMKALRLAVKELEECDKVVSHYYSSTYGKCYWCDRAHHLGVDIFPGQAKPHQPSYTSSKSQVANSSQAASSASSSSLNSSQSAQPVNQASKNQNSPSERLVKWVIPGIVVILGFYLNQIYVDSVQPPAISTREETAEDFSQETISTHPKDITLDRTIKGHSGWVKSVVAMSPDGQTIVSGSGDNTIKVWNLDTGELLHTLEGHSDSVNSVAISPNGRTIVSGSDDETVKVWQVQGKWWAWR